MYTYVYTYIYTCTNMHSHVLFACVCVRSHQSSENSPPLSLIFYLSLSLTLSLSLARTLSLSLHTHTPTNKDEYLAMGAISPDELSALLSEQPDPEARWTRAISSASSVPSGLPPPSPSVPIVMDLSGGSGVAVVVEQEESQIQQHQVDILKSRLATQLCIQKKCSSADFSEFSSTLSSSNFSLSHYHCRRCK